jgi:hypothetical protein
MDGFEPPAGSFSVSVVNHRGQGATLAWPIEVAAAMFAELADMPGGYSVLAGSTWTLLRKYLRRRRTRDAERLVFAALSAAIASPYCDFTGHFSAAVREHNRAAISFAFGKKRGLVITVAERVADPGGLLKAWTRAGLGPGVVIGGDSGKEVMQ